MKRTLPTVLLAALASIAALASAGCVSIHPGSARDTTWEELRAEPGWLLLDAVPFVPQETERDCGAACLSMVLAHWDVDAPRAAIERECSVEGLDGMRASALRDAAKRRGLSAFVFRGGVKDLEHELSRGRPVVVGLVKSIGPMTLTHFEVVVGLNSRDGHVAALDPARGLVRDALPSFSDEWAPAGGVTLVVFRPQASGATARAADAP